VSRATCAEVIRKGKRKGEPCGKPVLIDLYGPVGLTRCHMHMTHYEVGLVAVGGIMWLTDVDPDIVDRMFGLLPDGPTEKAARNG